MGDRDEGAGGPGVRQPRAGRGGQFPRRVTPLGGDAPPRRGRAGLVRPVRTECLDSILIHNKRHLHRVRTIYLHHYNTARPHRSLDLQTPLTVPSLAASRDVSATSDRVCGRARWSDPRVSGVVPDRRRTTSWRCLLVGPRVGGILSDRRPGQSSRCETRPPAPRARRTSASLAARDTRSAHLAPESRQLSTGTLHAWPPRSASWDPATPKHCYKRAYTRRS